MLTPWRRGAKTTVGAESKSVRIDRALWISALALVSIFAGGTLVLLVRMGWFSRDNLKCFFGMDPPQFSASDIAIVVALFLASHLSPLLVRRRRIVRRALHAFGEDATYRTPPSQTPIFLDADRVAAAERSRRLVALAWSLSFALAIACFGFFSIRHSPHAPCQHPLEWLSYFAVSAVALLSHIKRGMFAR
jgi:hypothetical protein